MALSPTVRQADFKSSIKAYFLDNLETTEGIKIFFEELESQPLDASGQPLDAWIIVEFGDRTLGPVSEQQISLILFTRNDREGDDLAAMEDKVMNYIVDETSPNGLHTIPYYDASGTPWVLVGGIIPFPQVALGRMEGTDGIQYKSVNLLCKWGGK